MDSPKKKKIKVIDSLNSNGLKRESEATEEATKRQKTSDKIIKLEDLQAKKRKNFITACEIVSYKAYFNYESRFQLIYIPVCAKNSNACKHHDLKHKTAKSISNYTEESFKIEMTTNMWRESLEVCRFCITKNQYLSAGVLKGVVEIMMNAHDDPYADYTTEYLITKCQEIFQLNFSYHPPCLTKTLRKCYHDFLTTPMELKENTFTNRTEFGSEKGVVKYCLNRLEHELSIRSKNEPMLDKKEHMPDEFKETVRGLHWQKTKFEIYENLDRTQRINRIMSVLNSIVELLQYDLAIWHSRYTNNLGCHIMRSHKPLMAYLLWSDNVLFTGAVNHNCRQILKLFTYLVHLKYPESHINTITAWLNIMVQTFYICENNSNSDYPNIGKYCMGFANEFYKIIAEMPHKSIIRILERIKPDYMQHLIGMIHTKTLLNIQEEDPIKILSIFIEKSLWDKFKESTTEIQIHDKKNVALRKSKSLFSYLKKRCEYLQSAKKRNETVFSYLRFDPLNMVKDSDVYLNHVVHTLYITLDAYLDAYSVQSLQESLDTLNELLVQEESSYEGHKVPEFCSYTVTENFIKKYRSIYQALRELMIQSQNIKNIGHLPKSFKVFEKIGLLGM